MDISQKYDFDIWSENNNKKPDLQLLLLQFTKLFNRSIIVVVLSNTTKTKQIILIQILNISKIVKLYVNVFYINTAAIETERKYIKNIQVI